MSIRSFTSVRSLATLVASLTTSLALSQSFNIDMDIGSGSEAVGNGAPSSAFGAAANQRGFWNRIDAASHTRPWALRGLSGNITSATIKWNASGGGSGYNASMNTGSYRLLLNDGTPITVPTTYVFENLTPGRYTITTYSVSPSGNAYPTRVTIFGAVVPVKVSGNGTMPGDRFTEGVTHCVHELAVSGSSFSLVVESLFARPNYGAVNGFQIAYEPVPEPLPWLGLILGICGLVAQRRRQ